MEYGKRDNFVVLTELKQPEIFAILKCQIDCTLTFNKNGVYDYIDLYERLLQDNVQMIRVGTKEIKDPKIISYESLIKMIQDKMKVGIIAIEIFNDTFKKKEPLVAILETIKQSFIENAVFIDYNDGIFSVVNKPIGKGNSDKLYYFEENNSILFFGVDGPRLIYNKPDVNSIEDLICE